MASRVGSSTIATPARVARNSAGLLVARLTSLLAAFLTLPILYDRLGAPAFGVWALLSGLIAWVAYADLGLGSAQIREVARAVGSGRHRQARAVLGVGVIWGASLGTLALAGCWLCWPWIAALLNLGSMSGPARDATLLLLVGFWVATGTVPWRAVLEGTQRYLLLSMVEIAAAVLTAGLTILVLLSGGGLVALAAATTAVNACRAIAIVAMASLLTRELTPSIVRIRRSDLRVALRYGLPVQVSNAAAAVNNDTDRLMLGAVIGPTAVAGFEPGSKLANLLRLPPSFLMTAVFPAAASAAAGDPRRLDRLYVTMTRYLAAFAALGVAVLVVSADPLIRLWLGQPLPLASTTVVVLGVGYAINVTVGAASVVTRAEGAPGRETRYALVAAALNIVLTLPLLHLLGAWGAPLSTTIAASVASGYFFVHFHRRSGRSFRPLTRALFPPTLAAAVAVGLTSAAVPLLPDGTGRGDAFLAVASRSGMALVLTTAVLVALRYFDTHDLARLRAALAAPADRRPVAPAAGPRRPESPLEPTSRLERSSR
ncbi:oligosaccharide flippase family protein [Actinopolymorpha pittospori]|uniref:O-antigen/teichoic acid export membrane protein n=1 Tax=Actinopolymorpha pittospori TaxID=648752 RepID=A0A927N912_9ACTN|nr:O-antigen/teichoic acid export membrane protein [Actinopolymorpha pittospori]